MKKEKKQYMQAAVLKGPGKIQFVKNYRLPVINKDSILVKVVACGVCGSDIRIIKEGNNRVSYPKIIGHEIAGCIKAVGKNIKKFKINDKISIGADVPSKKIKDLAIGYQINGGYAEYLLLDSLILKYGPIQKFNSNLSYDLAALAEPLACCLHGFEKMNVKKGLSFLIFGAGPIGIMLASLAKFYGAKKIILVEPENYRISLAKKIIRGTFINPKKTNLVKKIMNLTKGKGIDRIFTACTNIQTHNQSIKVIGDSGIINFFGGISKSDPPIKVLSNTIHYKEISITGSHGATPEHHKKALKLLEKRKINLTKIISHKFPLSKISDALKKINQKQTMKIIIKP